MKTSWASTVRTAEGRHSEDRSWILEGLGQQTEVVPGHAEPNEFAAFAAASLRAALPQAETSPELIDASWRQARQLVEGVRKRALRDHRAVYARRLESETDRRARFSVLDLLSELSETHGVAWADIASMLGVSVPALRKWRKTGGGTSPENHRNLAALTAFFSLLDEFTYSPARWMSMPLVDGFNVRPADVYSPERATALLDLAAGNAGVSAPSVLDGMDPDWRERWRSRYEVFEAADGELSMRPRQG